MPPARYKVWFELYVRIARLDQFASEISHSVLTEPSAKNLPTPEGIRFGHVAVLLSHFSDSHGPNSEDQPRA